MGRAKHLGLDEQGRKRCPGCETWKHLEEFGPDNDKKYGRRAWCLVCERKRASEKYDLAYFRNLYLIRVYGITSEQYDEMYKAQSGVCAICKRPETRRAPGRTKRSNAEAMLHVDHNHETGIIRALLCAECNTALGALHEDPKRILALIDYLQKHSEPA